MSKPLMALTLTHPWAAAIAHLGKDIENRTWHPEGNRGHVGMYLAIHGGTHPGKLTGESQKVLDFWDDVTHITRNWKTLMEHGARQGCVTKQGVERFLVRKGGMARLDGEALIIPGIVAVARVVGVVRNSDSPWAAQGQYHWQLADVTPIEPVPCRGAQKLWQVPAMEAELVRRRWKAARGGAQ